MTQCVILCGGLGTRARAISDKVPKSMIMVGDKPFIHLQLNWLSFLQVKDIVLCVGYLGKQIMDFVEDGSKWDVNVKYVDEGETLLGTGGALRLALTNNVLDDKFLVTYGDSFLPIDFIKVMNAAKKSTKPAMMAIIENNDSVHNNNVIFENGVLSLYDKKADSELRAKMNYIDYGVSVLTKEIIQYTPSDLSDLFTYLSRRNKLDAFIAEHKFHSIGSPRGLAEFKNYLGV